MAGGPDPGEQPAKADDDELMTRREIAVMFGTTSQVVAYWARRKRLTEVRTADNKPRYRRSEVRELWDSGFRW